MGAISSANILLETSMAKTTSIPSLFTVSILLPILGLAKPMIKLVKAKSKTVIFKTGLKTDFSGLNFLTNSTSPNSRCFFLFQYKLIKKSITIIGITAKKYKYIFSSICEYILYKTSKNGLF